MDSKTNTAVAEHYGIECYSVFGTEGSSGHMSTKAFACKKGLPPLLLDAQIVAISNRSELREIAAESPLNLWQRL